MPDMTYVDSSSVAAIGYDAARMELHVLFVKTGKTYVYTNVEEWVYHDFLTAPSKGIYLNATVKKNYQFYEL